MTFPPLMPPKKGCDDNDKKLKLTRFASFHTLPLVESCGTCVQTPWPHELLMSLSNVQSPWVHLGHCPRAKPLSGPDNLQQIEPGQIGKHGVHSHHHWPAGLPKSSESILESDYLIHSMHLRGYNGVKGLEHRRDILSKWHIQLISIIAACNRSKVDPDATHNSQDS